MNDAKMFIYTKESTNRTSAVNQLGCIGLGQACPFGAKPRLLAACPNWAIDYACQDAFWETYMKERYGSWERAKAHWLARVPIDGQDVGNWW